MEMTGQERRLGGHVDQDAAITQAEQLGGTICQLFVGNPQSWQGPDIGFAGGATGLRDAARAAGIGLYVHAPYLINVATSNNRVRVPSRRLLQKTLNAAAEIEAAAVVVHGGHVLATDDPELGFANWRKCLDSLDVKVPLLIENTAGGANAMARKLDRLDALWQALADSPNFDRLGFCLDTCHAHAAGIELDTLVDQVLSITGRIDLLHLNDSRDAFGSGADRHANLGKGNCGLAALSAIVRATNAPIIVETPGAISDRHADLTWLREQLG
jgi:deoxyribonuclease-4